MEPKTIPLEVFAARHAEIRASWRDALRRAGGALPGGKLVAKGFRPPQIGALHAIKAHWVVSDAPATLVMPTGTGKTETMLAALVFEEIAKLLVVVPSDQLRTQISQKFVTLGVLKAFGLLAPEAQYPVVAMLKHAPTSEAEVDDIFGRAQVVVATMQSLARLPRPSRSA